METTKTLITKEFLLSLGFEEHKGPLLIAYDLDISFFKNIYKVLSITISPGNTYIYLREGSYPGKRETDDIVTFYNADIQGPLTCEYVETLVNLLRYR